MSNQFFNSDQEEEKLYRKMIISCVAAASLVVLLFLVVLYTNSADKKKAVNAAAVQNEPVEDDGFVYGESNVVSSDLDFWDMYDGDTEEESEDEEGTTTPYKGGSSKKGKNRSESGESGDETMNDGAEKDLGSSDEENNDGDHLAVVDENGKTTYYEILDNVDKNDYKLDSLLNKNTDGFAEYKDDNNSSQTGITLDKNAGDVDFAKVKASNIDFCMIRIGFRGDSTGVVSLDENFVKYAVSAKENGINIGAYFTSSAINEAEAVEEASFAVGAGNNYGIRYPIAIDLNGAKKDASSRNTKLTMKERTSIVKAFCDTVKQYNYTPVIKADRATLISCLNLEDLNGIDVWISDYNYPTDYPYAYKMWQYSNDIKVDGCYEGVPISISFVDYSER